MKPPPISSGGREIRRYSGELAPRRLIQLLYIVSTPFSLSGIPKELHRLYNHKGRLAKAINPFLAASLSMRTESS